VCCEVAYPLYGPHLPRGESAIGRLCSRLLPELPAEGPNGASSCQHLLPAISPTPNIGGRRVRSSRLGRLPATYLNSVDFRRCRMPWLPMLKVRRGSEGTETKPHRSTGRLAPTQRFMLVRPDPLPARRTEKFVGTRINRGTSDAGGLLTAGEAATNQRVNWRACDEGLHYWTGREDL
jgi:hypothetical protein